MSTFVVSNHYWMRRCSLRRSSWSAYNLQTQITRQKYSPKIRLLSGESTASSSSSSLRTLWDNGTLLMGVGSVGLALLVVDRGLQYWDAKNVHSMMGIVQDEQRQTQLQLLQYYESAPVLFECRVQKQYKNLGGSHGLQNVQLNQVLQVLEEQVGPDKYYNMCRIVDDQGQTKAVGWYPMSYLEKIQPKSKMQRVVSWLWPWGRE